MKKVSDIGVLVGIGSKYFEYVEGLKLNAAAAITQSVHDHLSNTVSGSNKRAAPKQFAHFQKIDV